MLASGLWRGAVPFLSRNRASNAGGTRTCIHTPAEPLEPSEISEARIDEILAGAQLVFFDGRLAEAALRIAQAARRKQIPILVEAERLRPGLNDLLAHADYVITSASFPQVRHCVTSYMRLLCYNDICMCLENSTAHSQVSMTSANFPETYDLKHLSSTSLALPASLAPAINILVCIRHAWHPAQSLA